MIRLRRLQSDWEGMRRLAEESSLVEFTATGAPPEKYLVTFRCKGLVRTPGRSQPSISSFHRVEIYLHAQYPRLQPRLTWLTPIFHPNILSPDHNGGVCIGKWTPAETLRDLCLRIGEMVQYREYNPDDPLDLEAAAWVKEHAGLLPVDTRPLIAPRPAGVTGEIEVTS